MNLLRYAAYTNHMLLDEQHWKNYRGNALEDQLTSFLNSRVRNLTCATVQYAGHAGVSLDERAVESVKMITYDEPTQIKRSDIFGFITVNWFERNFLSFTERFFEGYNESYVHSC